MITFALMTPLGIVIGALISEGKTDDLSYVISIATLQGKAL